MDNKGLVIAGASVAAGLGLGRLGAASELNNLHVLGKVEGEYSMIKPGPLNERFAETFSGGAYKGITLSQDTTFLEVVKAAQSWVDFSVMNDL